MSQYVAQIERIKAKLLEARQADPKLTVFGASSHLYSLGLPVSAQQVRAFEQKYQLQLPEDYKCFVTQVGNGGKSTRNSGAGPFYGIFRFGSEVDEIIEDPLTYLAQPSPLVPDMSSDHWNALIARIEADDVSDEEFTEQTNKLFQGLLPIGSQGCAYVTALVVSGVYKGRVVNIDLDRQKPWFAYEANFLDWYERWLDEILLGYLQPEGSLWFGSVLGGTEQELIEKYASASEEQKEECLRGFSKLPAVAPEAIEFLASEADNRTQPISELALQLLTKFAYKRAQERLKKRFHQMPLPVLQYVHWYAKEFVADWRTETQTLLRNGIDEAELFRFASYVLTGTRSEIQALLTPYTVHPDENIRAQATYILSQHTGSIAENVGQLIGESGMVQLSKAGQIVSKIKRWFS